MNHIYRLFVYTFLCLLFSHKTIAQSCSGMNFQHKADITKTCSSMPLTMIHDVLDRPFLYVANKDAGLTIYDITTITSPALVKTIATTSFESLHVINLTQSGNYLYLALGDIFNTNQASGMAIVDISTPGNAVVVDYWVLPGLKGGAGIVKVEGNYAYLGAMGNGLVILDVTNKNDIQFVSRFVPNINYPPIQNPDAAKINARGMEVKNSIVYLCYDAGGFRVINCTNKSAPVETGRYCNPATYIPFNRPRAYNNIVIDDTVAYITVDYCGVEVLNIKDTSHVKLMGWWNPYNCPNNNWFSSPSHTNEIYYDNNCDHLFLSTGKSDMMVLDVSNPAAPDSCNFYGGVANSTGTWGIGLYQNQIYLSYICAVIPFPSNWTGVKILTYTPCTTGLEHIGEYNNVVIYPVPANDKLVVETYSGKAWKEFSICNSLGQEFNLPSTGSFSGSFILDVSSLPAGVYTIRLSNDEKMIARKFIKSANDD